MGAGQSCAALFISAPASHQGKTTVTAAIARHHRNLGRRVRVFKTGPDFIDPMVLERAAGNPVYQLDLWMMGEQRCRQLVQAAAGNCDLILIEGVMGLFDGTSCSADLAMLFDLPVAFVIDASGMAQSLHAVAHGLATYRKGLKAAGIIANNVASDRHAEMLAADASQSLPLLAAIARRHEDALPSRHLGLWQAQEIEDLDEKLDRFAQSVKGTKLAELPEAVVFTGSETANTAANPRLEGLRIAIAKDTAFSFIYKDNIDWLESAGAKLLWFSPLSDQQVPSADAIYLPGGYPELHLDRLAANHSMKESIRRFHEEGGTIYAECGGMLYLLERLTASDGTSAELVGLIPGQAFMQKRLAALGYQLIEFDEGEARGHTFHYSKLELAIEPFKQARRYPSQTPGESVVHINGLTASYVHLYFRSAPQAVASLFTRAKQISTASDNPHAICT